MLWFCHNLIIFQKLPNRNLKSSSSFRIFFDIPLTTNGTGLSKWFVRMASEIVERETTTNVLHSPFCVTFRESCKIEESKSTFDTYLFISNFTIHKVLQTPKFTFRFLNSNEWATHYLQMHMLSKFFETVRTSILCWCFLFRWTNKTGSKWFKILRNWEFLQLCVEHFLLIFSFRDRI